MNVLLIQAREQLWKLRLDSRIFFRSLGIKKSQFKTVNIFSRRLSMNDIVEFDAVIIGGSKYDVDDNIPNINVLRKLIRQCVESGTPLLGVCFGAQLIADTLGGTVLEDTNNQEFGTFMMEKMRAGERDPLLARMPKKFLAQCAHHDRVFRLPEGAILLARSKKCPVQAFRIRDTNVYGVQFHPERSKATYSEGLLHEFSRYSKKQRELKYALLAKSLRALKPTSTEKILKNFLKIARF